MSKHSNVCGGSSAARRLYCPASYQLEENAPKTTSEFAERGSMLHAGMELVLTNFPNNMKEAQPLVDQCVGQDFGFKYEPIDEELVATKLGPALTTWFKIFNEYKIFDWMIEVRTSLEMVIDGAFGTADIVAVDKAGGLHILDWKFGDGVPVPAEENESLMFYAAAALYDEDDDLADLTKDMDDDTPVYLHIVQPTDRTDDPHDVWKTDVRRIEKFLDALVPALELARKPDPVPKPGDYCRWCSASSACPATKQLVAATAKKKIEGMDAAELGTFLTQLKMVVAVKEKAFSHAQKLLETGHVIPGWKLVPKRGQRHWKDEGEAWDIMRKTRLKRDDYLETKLRSPAQMEKLQPKLYCKRLSALVHSQSSGLTIAPDSDKRPAVVGSVELLANALDKASPPKGDTKSKT